MGHYQFRLHDIGEGIAEAEIVAWHVAPGQVVEEDAPLVDVMTDKATVEMTSPVAGSVVAVHGEVGARVPVGSVLADFDVAGTDAGRALPVTAHLKAPRPEPPQLPPVVRQAAASAERSVPGIVAAKPPASSGPLASAPLAAPATRRRAHELGIKLQFVPGTGPAGRITPADLDAYVAAGGAGSASAPGVSARSSQTETRIVGLRRRIGERMQDAKRRIPHITYVEECDMTELEALRRELTTTVPRRGRG